MFFQQRSPNLPLLIPLSPLVLFCYQEEERQHELAELSEQDDTARIVLELSVHLTQVGQVGQQAVAEAACGEEEELEHKAYFALRHLIGITITCNSHRLD